MMRYLIVCSAALLLAAAAQAQDVTTGHLDIIDTNDDGAIDVAEFDAFMGRVFSGLDTNSDGYVTEVEGAEWITPEHYAAANANGDGGLSMDEFMTAVRADFAALDQDDDGLLN